MRDLSGQLDLRGHRCPVPVIRLEAALRRLAPGEEITVLADDPVAAVDIPHFCQAGGHKTRRLPDQGENGEICVFRVTRGPKLTL